MFSKPRGVSLLELMLVLLIIAIITFSATYYFRVVLINLRVAQAEEMINNIVNAAYKWNEGTTNFTTLTLDQLINAGLVPTSYRNNPWQRTGASVQVSGSTNSPNSFFITFNSVPATDCQNLAEKIKRYAWKSSCDPKTNNFEAAFGTAPPTVK